MLCVEESSRTCALIFIGSDASEANVGSRINALPVAATTQPQIVPARSESVPRSPQIDISRQCTVNCNVNVSTLSCYLAGHPDQAFVCKLINSLQFGFDIGFRGKRGSVYMRNRPLALAHSEGVCKYLDKELECGQTEGPFLNSPSLTLLAHCDR